MKKERRKNVDNETTWRESSPGGLIYDAGCAEDFMTGDWRSMKPVWLQDKCKQCMLCWPVCPDTAIPVKDGKREDFDYDHCKGCLVCVEVCPFGAITAEEEGK